MSLSELIIDIPAEYEMNVFGQFDTYIKKIERRQSIFKNSLKETINIEFNRALNNRTKDKQISPCNHDIWLYQGSYYIESL